MDKKGNVHDVGKLYWTVHSVWRSRKAIMRTNRDLKKEAEEGIGMPELILSPIFTRVRCRIHHNFKPKKFTA
jgi:hypothetical protein